MPVVDKLHAKLKKLAVASATNAKIKAWLVERDALGITRRYSALAKSSGLSAPQGHRFTAALNQRLASRSRSLGWPKPLGMLHIFLVYPHCNWESVLPEVLSAFGSVSTFEWRSRGFDESSNSWLHERDEMNRQMLCEFERVNRQRPVDVVIGYLSGYTVGLSTLLAMADSGAVIANFCFDDKIRWPGAMRGGRFTSPAAICRAVDLNLSSDPNSALRYYAHGGLCMFHPEAADPEWFRPLDMTYEYDVSFVGARYGYRPVLVDGLLKRGIRVECFGNGWPNGPIPNEMMNKVYAKSRINLGCGGVGFSNTLMCLKGRDFEVPMSGGLYLTQQNPELSLVFDIGQEILTYSTIDDCALRIREMLNDETKANSIREAARARCLRDHTYFVRWSSVLQTLGAL